VVPRKTLNCGKKIALNVGRSLGFSSNMATYIRFRCSRSSIKMLGKPEVGEILHAGQELDNAVYKLAVKVVQNNETVSHLPYKYSRILWLSHVAEKLLQTPVRRNGDVGMEIPCRLVFSLSSKVKINRLKELLESKIRR